MPAPPNLFRARLKSGVCQYGLWVSLGEAYSTEILGRAGFDWLLIDGEHAPNDVRSIMRQLQALSGSSSHPVVRPPVGEPIIIKRLLDIGVQTLLIPMVETSAQASELVKMTRYPPHGIRGVGSVTRASGFGRTPEYLKTANDEICLLVQVETPLGIRNIPSIAAVDGVDGIFIGPADLAAGMGHLGDVNHPDVVKAIGHAIEDIRQAGSAAGILAIQPEAAKLWVAASARFVAVGIDVGLLADSASRLLAAHK